MVVVVVDPFINPDVLGKLLLHEGGGGGGNTYLGKGELRLHLVLAPHRSLIKMHKST